MPELPKKKVGIVACSGEELAEGTVTRLAALSVLEQLRPSGTVTICLPLFLAGGEGDRAFARFYPTIALDGCGKRCAARATAMYSSEPAAGVVVTDFAPDGIGGRRRLNEAGRQAVEAIAGHVAGLVDELLQKKWNRRAGQFVETGAPAAQQPAGLWRNSGHEPHLPPQRSGAGSGDHVGRSEPAEASIPTQDMVLAKAQVEAAEGAACSCGSSIPSGRVVVDGQAVTLVALPAIFQQAHEAGKLPVEATAREMLGTVKIYNVVSAGADAAYIAMLLREYAAFCETQALTA